MFKVEKSNNRFNGQRAYQVYALSLVDGMTLSIVAAFSNRLEAQALADALNETLSIHKKIDSALA